ncbi:MAG: cyclic nucleotide-binding domain-containing protein [Spirochaetota bacterium]|nr:cyclic nucleotide-binding domain-containing protein [Spirochaetota bacterium]
MIPADEIKKYPFFKDLSDQAIKEISENLEFIQVEANTEIIKQNTPGDYFYFIKEGELEVTKRNKYGQNAKISTLKSGEGFGEMALLTCSHRQNTVKTKTDCQLYRLSKASFEQIVMMDSNFKSFMSGKTKDYVDYNKVKTWQPLALLEPEKVLALSDKFFEKTFQKGEYIIQQGEKPDNYFIIKSGRAEVIRHDPERGIPEPTVIDIISEGYGVGEEAIIREEERKASVKVLEETVVMCLDKKDFNSILKTSFLDFSFPEEVFEEEWQKYVFIDARIPSEYEEEHIEGALNIPLERLRQSYHELDPSREYLTYCTNDSRGMSAAFLLTSQGFNAKNLRSGLSGWEGPTKSGESGVYYPV